MARFSPTVRPRDPLEGRPSTSEKLIEALGLLQHNRELERRRKIEDEERDRGREIEDFRLRMDVENDPRFTTRQPEGRPGRVDVPDPAERFRSRDAFEGERLGMAGEIESGRDPLFGGLGLQDGPGGPDFASLLEASAPAVEGGEDRPRFLPGQFVREAGLFTERPIFDAPKPTVPMLDFENRERPEPFATVAGLDVFEDPAFRTPAQERLTEEAREEERLAGLIELVGQARAGDQEALDQLLVQDPELFDAVAGGEDGLTPDDLRRAGVPGHLIPVARQDPTFLRGLLTPEESDLGFRDRLEDLAEAGVPRQRAEAIARDPATYRRFVEGEMGLGRDGSTTIQELVARRQVVSGALAAVRALNSLYLRENFAFDDPAYEDDLRRTLEPFGYDALDELQADARQLRTLGVAPEPEPDPGSPRRVVRGGSSSPHATQGDLELPPMIEGERPDSVARPLPDVVQEFYDVPAGTGEDKDLNPGQRDLLQAMLDNTLGGAGEEPAAHDAVEDSARSIVRNEGWDPETARRNLRAAGFDDDEIERILGAAE